MHKETPEPKLFLKDQFSWNKTKKVFPIFSLNKDWWRFHWIQSSLSVVANPFVTVVVAAFVIATIPFLGRPLFLENVIWGIISQNSALAHSARILAREIVSGVWSVQRGTQPLGSCCELFWSLSFLVSRGWESLSMNLADLWRNSFRFLDRFTPTSIWYRLIGRRSSSMNHHLILSFRSLIFTASSLNLSTYSLRVSFSPWWIAFSTFSFMALPS